MVQLVTQIISLYQQLDAAKINNERIALKRQIEAIDNQIDRLVFDLYDLSDDETAIIRKK